MISFHFSRGTWKSWSRYNTYPKGTSAPTVTLLMRVPACVTSASPLLPGNNMRQAKHEQLNGSKVYIPRLVSQGRRGETLDDLAACSLHLPRSITIGSFELLPQRKEEIGSSISNMWRKKPPTLHVCLPYSIEGSFWGRSAPQETFSKDEQDKKELSASLKRLLAKMKRRPTPNSSPRASIYPVCKVAS